MSYALSVFGTSASCPTRRELAEFISDGAYLEEEPVFAPPVDSDAGADQAWRSFALRTGHGAREIALTRHLGDGVVRDQVARLLFVVGKTSPTKNRGWVMEKLERSSQLITISFDADATPRNEWEMLDCLESFMARRCEGMIYAPREGFYDADLLLRHRI